MRILDIFLHDHRWGLGFCVLAILGVAWRLYWVQALTRPAFVAAVSATLLIGGGLLLTLGS